MDLEDDKRSLIHREIDKFRDTYKVFMNDFMIWFLIMDFEAILRSYSPIIMRISSYFL